MPPGSRGAGRTRPFPTPSRTSEEHVERLLSGGEEVPAELRREASEEPELTNEDLFWDL
jgi:hypothetical protein